MLTPVCSEAPKLYCTPKVFATMVACARHHSSGQPYGARRASGRGVRPTVVRLVLSERVRVAQPASRHVVQPEVGPRSVLLVEHAAEPGQVDHAAEVHALPQPEPLYILPDILALPRILAGIFGDGAQNPNLNLPRA